MVAAMNLLTDPAAQLREHGVVLLHGVLSAATLAPFRDAAVRCFSAIGAAPAVPEPYRFSPSSHSVLLTSLLDFGFARSADLLAPLSAPALTSLLSHDPHADLACSLDQSWLRKKFAPQHAPLSGYHLQNWHQDGALGVRFPPQPGPLIPMTRLLTCWIPLDPCGIDSPGLEFVRRRQPALLHFTELADASLRRRFPPEDFWAPALEPGDALVFTNDALHRTHAHPGMRHDRLSVEYRLFPR